MACYYVGKRRVENSAQHNTIITHVLSSRDCDSAQDIPGASVCGAEAYRMCSHERGITDSYTGTLLT